MPVLFQEYLAIKALRVEVSKTLRILLSHAQDSVRRIGEHLSVIIEIFGGWDRAEVRPLNFYIVFFVSGVTFVYFWRKP